MKVTYKLTGIQGVTYTPLTGSSTGKDQVGKLGSTFCRYFCKQVSKQLQSVRVASRALCASYAWS